jgi:hypothetical protein
MGRVWLHVQDEDTLPRAIHAAGLSAKTRAPRVHVHGVLELLKIFHGRACAGSDRSTRPEWPSQAAKKSIAGLVKPGRLV